MRAFREPCVHPCRPFCRHVPHPLFRRILVGGRRARARDIDRRLVRFIERRGVHGPVAQLLAIRRLYLDFSGALHKKTARDRHRRQVRRRARRLLRSADRIQTAFRIHDAVRDRDGRAPAPRRHGRISCHATRADADLVAERDHRSAFDEYLAAARRVGVFVRRVPRAAAADGRANHWSGVRRRGVEASAGNVNASLHVAAIVAR